MQRRWTAVFALLVAIIVAAGCGRVNLEDLTPEAVRTQLALTPSPAASSGTPGGTEVPGAGQGNMEAGDQLYHTWCTGCHDTGRLNAPPIKGKTFVVADWIPVLRAPGDKAKHPSSYPSTQISDNNYDDIFAYLAATQP